MDHVGDMGRYIQQGLRTIGYSGLVGWDPDDPDTLDVIKRHDEWVYDETTDTLTLTFVMGKDMPFRITIEHAR